MAMPNIYETIDHEKVRQLAEFGHNDAFMARFFGVALSTWRNWRGLHPEFDALLDESKGIADSRVRKSLYECATGYEFETEETFKDKHTGRPIVVKLTKFVPPNPIAGMFWLKCREPDQWKDKQIVEQTGEVNHNVKVQQQDLDDRIKRVATKAAEERVDQIAFGKEMEDALR